jgi:hypothetical protein
MCPKKYFWRWKKLLAVKKKNKNTQIGTLTHNCLHLWYKHVNVPDERELFVESYLKSPEIASQYTQEEIIEATRLMRKLMSEYPSESFEVVYPEVTVVIQNLFENVDYELTMDGVIRLIKEGKPGPILVYEHKTVSQGSGPVITSYLNSPQTLGYVYACRHALKLNVVGALYNFLVKTVTPQIIRTPVAITGEKKLRRWYEYTVRTIAEIDACEKDGVWREVLSSCHTRMGACDYDPLCTSLTDVALESYEPAGGNPRREEVIVVDMSKSAQLNTVADSSAVTG